MPLHLKVYINFHVYILNLLSDLSNTLRARFTDFNHILNTVIVYLYLRFLFHYIRLWRVLLKGLSTFLLN
jgi:hypothetical protein